MLISKPTAQELLEVIQRPELVRKYRSLGRISVQQVIDLLARAELVDIGAPTPGVRDPKDDIFVATAIAGRADFIVSEDKDLLDLEEVSGIPIVDTCAFIEQLSTDASIGVAANCYS
jgi:putative PIN family toxin of toxin-antitoxin system